MGFYVLCVGEKRGEEGREMRENSRRKVKKRERDGTSFICAYAVWHLECCRQAPLRLPSAPFSLGHERERERERERDEQKENAER